MKIFDFEQGSDSWWKIRRGTPTASEFGRILTPKTGKLAAAAAGYIESLIADTFDPEYPRKDDTATLAMRRGIALEPDARRWLEFELDHNIEQVGFCLTDDGRFGCSPDGLIKSQRKGVELKSPLPHTHIRWLLEGTLPDEHRAQCHGGMIVTGYEDWVFCSHCPGLPPLIVEVQFDEYTAKLRSALEEFWTDYQDKLGRVMAMVVPE